MGCTAYDSSTIGPPLSDDNGDAQHPVRDRVASLGEHDHPPRAKTPVQERISMSQNPSIGLVKPEETSLAAEELAAVEKLQKGFHNMRAELGKVIVGQEAVIEELLIALFCRGHAMLEGVPGLAKTLLISTLSRTLGLSFNRIQFTPDLMPSDITGTEVIEEDKVSGGRQMRFVRGPIFANVILADE